MSAKIIDGKRYAEDIRRATMVESKYVGEPGLYIISAVPDKASEVYVKQKMKAAKAWNIFAVQEVYTKDYSDADIITRIHELNKDETVHGIIVQLPLPPGFNTNAVIDAIHPDKDVDGLHPANFGELAQDGYTLLEPCTASGIMYMLIMENIPLEGKHAVIIGRSNLVGKPLVPMLLRRDATVTVCHSKTENLEAYTKTADILISATGVPGLITKDMVKPGACVIDVGISRVNGKIVGDVDFENVKEVAGWITPVPGGVGPMTVAMLMNNAYIARTMCINS